MNPVPAFYELWDTNVRGTSDQDYVFRLVVGEAFSSGFRGIANSPYWRIDVQMWTPFLHGSAYPTWNAWDGIFPKHSTDAVVTGNFGSPLVEDGMFPWRVAGLPLFPRGAVLALAVPELQYRSPRAHNTIPHVQRRYPDPSRQHIDLGSRFPLSRISVWDSYWKDAVLKEVLASFGDVDPKPGVDTEWVWRLVYAPSHNRFVIQSQIPPSEGAGTWTNVSSEDGEPVNGTGPALSHFGFAYVDFFEQDRLYECPTVLGMHFGSTSGYSLARYDYGDLGHDRLTGSVDFQRKGCGCASVPVGQREFKEPATCGPLSYTDVDPPAVPVPISSTDLGYNVDPATGSPLSGWEMANASNHIYTNFYLCGIREMLRAINGNLVEGVKELGDMRQMFNTRLANIEEALLALSRLGLDTSKLEKKLQEITDKMEDLFTVQF